MLTVLLLSLVAYLTYRLSVLSGEYRELLNKIPEYEEKARKEALKVSRRVIKGQISEQFAPFLPGFPYKAADLKFFGNGFDYVCVDGMAEARDTDSPITEIVFIDIKTNRARLSVIQSKIRDAIVEGRVAWETITINEDNIVSVKRARKKDEQDSNN